MAISSIAGQSTPTVKSEGTTNVRSISSSTTSVVRTSSASVARSNVSSATITRTPSTTQATNSSKTSTVRYSGVTASNTVVSSRTASSTSVSSTTVSSKTASSTAVSSTTVSSKTASSTLVSSTTISSSTIIATSDIPGYMIGREGAINATKDLFTDNLVDIIFDDVKEGVTYNLGEMEFFTPMGMITYSSDIEFHESVDDALIEVTREVSNEIRNEVADIDNFFKKSGFGLNEVTLSLFEGAAVSIADDGTIHLKASVGDYELDLNSTSFALGVFDLTISKSKDIDEYATLTNSIQFVIKVPQVPAPTTGDVPVQKEREKSIWDSICDVVVGAVDEVCDTIQDVAEDVWDGVTNLADVVWDAVEDMGEEVEDILGIAKANFEKVADDVGDWFVENKEEIGGTLMVGLLAATVISSGGASIPALITTMSTAMPAISTAMPQFAY